jgi:maltooligosyltrehalose trehalohydrolase
MRRRYPIGAEPTSDGVHFRVWAPRRARVAVVSERVVDLEREDDGYFSGLVAGMRAGARYKLRLDDEGDFPDPASRFQPEGPHGPSEVIDPNAFRWTDSAWRGPDIKRQVIYELHVGLYTREGTYRALIDELDELARLGITCIELLPLAEFPGRFGWGYDGVDLFAPSHLYGRPDDLRALLDAAHARGLAVIHDVVYNHLGPDGNYLGCYSHDYVTKKYPNEWGDALNFEGPRAVREFFVANARYWIDELHFDGLRLDATQSIHDASEPHILCEITRAVRAAAGSRSTLIVGENEPQHARMIHEYGLDMLWNDDFHHAARVATVGCDEAYFTDYGGTPQELVSAVKHGFLFQGQWYRWQKQRRGMLSRGLPRTACVAYIQNHDQVANSADGARIHTQTSPGRFRAITALTLLSPMTPMLFMGQEFASSKPFLYFADHKAELAAAVEKGRGEFLAQFPSIATGQMQLPKPSDVATYERCKLDLGERRTHAEVYALHQDLLRVRREDSVLATEHVDGAVLGPEAFCIRYFGRGEDRLLLVNLGAQLHLDRVPEPLLAPITRWNVVWSSEAPKYGGRGTPPVERDNGTFDLPAHSAVLLASGSEAR